MLGRVLNTHQQWLCRRLADLGYVVTRQVAVPDTAPDIQSAVREALSRADLVIATGGLGPTSDDLTRDLIAQLLGKKLRLDEPVLKHIQKRFAARNLPMPKNNEVQALVPEGAIVLSNPNGTAPGLAMKIDEDGGWKMENGEKASVPSSILNPPSSRFPNGWSCCPARRANCARCSTIWSCRCSSVNFRRMRRLSAARCGRAASPNRWCRKKSRPRWIRSRRPDWKSAIARGRGRWTCGCRRAARTVKKSSARRKPLFKKFSARRFTVLTTKPLKRSWSGF